MAWTDKQLLEERHMAELGEERFRGKISRGVASKNETRHGPGKTLLQVSVGRVMDSFYLFKKEQKHKRGRKHPMLSVFKDLTVPAVASLTCRAMLNELTQKQDLNALCRKVGSALEDEVAYKAYKKAHPKKWSSYLKRYSLLRLRSAIRMSDKGCWRWGVAKRHRVGLWCVHMFLDNTKLFQKQEYYHKKTKKIQIHLTNEALLWIKNAEETQMALTPFYLPTTSPPKDWKNGRDGGYLTPLVTTKTFVKTHHKEANALLRAASLEKIDLAVNNLQNTPWRVNEKILNIMQTLLGTDQTIVVLPTVTLLDIPPKPPEDASPETWKLWKITAGRTHRTNLKNSGKFLKAKMVTGVAEELRDSSLYFPQRLDYRGRVYPLPNYLNIQGDDFCKSLLLFGVAQPLGNSEASLGIHVANLFGQDKKNIAERLEWYYTNIDELCRVGEDPLEYKLWTEQAEPWRALAAAFEVSLYRKVGSRFLTNIPVTMDCSNNGLQMFSLLARDSEGAHWTNCTSHENRQDLYQRVAEKTIIPEIMRPFISTLPRECAKRPVMTLSYGATKHSCRRYVIDWFEDTYLDPLGNGNPLGFEGHYKACAELAENLWLSMESALTKPVEIMSWCQTVAEIFSKKNLGISWTSPTGLPILQKKQTASSYTIRTVVGESIRHIRAQKYRNSINSAKMRSSFSPNYIHSLDASMVHRVAGSFEGPLGTIHDCFATLSPLATDLQNTVRKEVFLMFQKNLLTTLFTELSRQVPGIPEPPSLGDFSLEDLLDSQYFLS